MIKKLGLVLVVLVALFAVTGFVLAQEAAKTEAAAPVMEATASAVEAPAAAVSVGNKVCPVTGEKIAELGKDTVEYQGKVYNMCCPMCKDKFLAEPDKYIAIVDKELAESAAPAVEEAK
ncbi:MAG: YHS domain-containing protein [Candidatus Omnitrophica bacterium]|nr:YHS domain-containing protein [Candidatus Omnitrophota bacterium]